MRDRIDTITELLLGAAYADDHFHESEKKAITELLGKLLKGEVTAEISEQIETFDPTDFNLAATAGVFADNSEDDKYKLLELIAAVHEADNEYDFAEDDYVRAVATALGLAGEDLARFTLEFEIEELSADLDNLRKEPPPSPGS